MGTMGVDHVNNRRERQGLQRAFDLGQIVDHEYAITFGIGRGLTELRFMFGRESIVQRICTKLMRGLKRGAPSYRRRSVLSTLIYCFNVRKMNGTAVALPR
jgi:hypothetical protein